MNEQQHFRRIVDGLDPTEALAELARCPELWSLITLRQQYGGSAHRDTETIVLRGPETAENLFDNLDAFDYPYFAALSATRDLIRRAIEPLRCRDFGRMMIVRLKAHGQITPHTDEGAYARYFARFHLVLDSTPGCIFSAGGESQYMAPGELWWFNHQVEHYVINTGPARTHIIIDLCAPGFTGALARPA